MDCRLSLGAAEAVTNANSLSQDAKLLVKERRFASGVALAAIGIEEAGKALLLALAAVDRPRGLKGWCHKLLRQHGVKHSLAQMADVIVYLVEDHRQTVADDIGEPLIVSADDQLEEVTSRFEEWILSEGLLETEGLRDFLVRRNKFQRAMASRRSEAAPFLGMTPEDWREAALYVDFKVNGVQAPSSSVSEADAMSTLYNLITYIGLVAPIVDYLAE